MQELTSDDDAFEFDFTVTRLEEPPQKWLSPPSKAPREPPKARAWPDAPSPRPWNIERIVKIVEAAGPNGIQRWDLQAQTELPLGEVDAALAALAREAEQRIFWAGYDNARLVAVTFWDQWSVDLTDKFTDPKDAPPEEVRVAPRRWVDIWGNIIPAEWERAIKLVVGHLITRPGITEHDLHARVANALDRLETCDVLQFLVDSDLATRCFARETGHVLAPVQATDTNEQKGVVWHVTESLWAHRV